MSGSPQIHGQTLQGNLWRKHLPNYYCMEKANKRFALPRKARLIDALSE